MQAPGITFITVTPALGTPLTGRGPMPTDLALNSAPAPVPTGLGLALGTRWRHHISEGRFHRMILIRLAGVGLDMLHRAFT